MERTRKVRGQRLGVLGRAADPDGHSVGAEFSASMLKDNAENWSPGKIQVSNGKLRQEFADEHGPNITIVRPDLRCSGDSPPPAELYGDPPDHEVAPRPVRPIPPQAVGKRLVGQERLNGYDTEKYEVSVPVAAAWKNRFTGWQQNWACPSDGVPGASNFPWNTRASGRKRSRILRFNLPRG